MTKGRYPSDLWIFSSHNAHSRANRMWVTKNAEITWTPWRYTVWGNPEIEQATLFLCFRTCALSKSRDRLVFSLYLLQWEWERERERDQDVTFSWASSLPPPGIKALIVILFPSLIHLKGKGRERKKKKETRCGVFWLFEVYLYSLWLRRLQSLQSKTIEGNVNKLGIRSLERQIFDQGIPHTQMLFFFSLGQDNNATTMANRE